MIDKLYDLKKLQRDQKLIEKAQLMSKISQIEAEVMFTQQKINTTSVERHGAISDFSILAIHKETMKMHIKKLNLQKNTLLKQLDIIVKEIIELQKESEQYKYILDEQKQEELTKRLLVEQEASDEYMQSKYISN
ncbi:MAG: hypothetical protein ACNI25_16950 [Halarcobacter sp.]